jgi:hypothetical protein
MTDSISQFLDDTLISRQRMPFSMVEDEGFVWIADIVESDVAMKIWI